MEKPILVLHGDKENEKNITRILFLSILICTFIGCNNVQEKPPSVSQQEQSEQQDTTLLDETQQPEEEIDEVPVEITVSFFSFESAPTEEDVQLVEDALNAITLDKINTMVNLNVMQIGDYIPGNAMATGVKNGEDYDLVLMHQVDQFDGCYVNMLNQDLLMPITDLLDRYAPELMELLPEEFLKATTKDGEIYAVPVYRGIAKNMYWMCKKDALETAQVDINTIDTIEEVESVLIKIKNTTEYWAIDNKIGSDGLTADGYSFGSNNKTSTYDSLGTERAIVIVECQNPTIATSRVGTEEFKKDAETTSRWMKMELFHPEAPRELDYGIEVDWAASEIYVGSESAATRYAKKHGAEKVRLANDVLTTKDLVQFTYAVPTSCDQPKAAIKFLNLLYTDETVNNILRYGVEGIHWEWKDDTYIGFPEGVTEETSGYFLGATDDFPPSGNDFFAYPWEGTDLEAKAMSKNDVDHASYSPLLGFVLDTSEIKSAWQALKEVTAREEMYIYAIEENGHDQYLQDLYDAGLQECIDEANRQLKEWNTQ